jgi:hypothetical protein
VRYLRTFIRFWWDFIVGDDWRLALGVLATISAVSVLADHGADPWWLLPPAIMGLLAASVSVAARKPGARSIDTPAHTQGDHEGEA